MKSRSKKHADSHDITWYIGKKRYGSTTAERDMLRTLAEDYGSLNAVWNAYEQNQIILGENEAAILKKLIETNTTQAELQQGTLSLDEGIEALERATKETMNALAKTGVEVVMATEEQVNDMLGLAEMQKRTAPETVSVQDEHLQTVVSSADGTCRDAKRTAPKTESVQDEHQPSVVSSAYGAKVLKDLDNAINEYEKDVKTKEKTFLGRLAEVLNAKKHGSNSQYATFEAVNGNVFTIRLANHNAKTSTFDNHNENEGISIVVTAQDNNEVTNDGNAHLVEFFYDAIKLRKAEGKPLVEILKSIKQALYSGEYKDNTGLAVREEVNIPEMMTVFHGSGAKFDRFDHSYMGTGEGAQAFGWGTYVTEVESCNVQERMGMTPEERKNSLAEETADVAKEDQIFLFDNQGTSAMMGADVEVADNLSNTDEEDDALYRSNEEVPRLDKYRVEKIFGGIWIEDEIEFAKFVSAVNNYAFEENGEGIAYTDNYFYAYYLNIDGQVIPFASVYLNSLESQDVVNQVKQEIKDGRKEERAKEYFDTAVERYERLNSQDNANNGNNSSVSNRGYYVRLGNRLLQKGRYYNRPDLYVKAQRADRFGLLDEYSREGTGAYSDEEINLANDPVSKALGKPRGTRKQRREFAQRERQRMAERVEGRWNRFKEGG